MQPASGRPATEFFHLSFGSLAPAVQQVCDEFWGIDDGHCSTWQVPQHLNTVKPHVAHIEKVQADMFSFSDHCSALFLKHIDPVCRNFSLEP